MLQEESVLQVKCFGTGEFCSIYNYYFDLWEKEFLHYFFPTSRKCFAGQ